MRSPTFFAPGYVSRSPAAANAQLINLYPEVNDVKGAGRGIGAFYQTPGLDLLTSVGSGPIRGSCVMADTLYVVSGSGFYSVDKNWNPALLGTVTSLPTPVSMITNGAQLAIFDGAKGFVYVAPKAATVSSAAVVASFAPINLPFTGPLSATYQDGFGLVNQVGTNAWWQSNLLDLTTWDALNFSTADSQPDDVIAIKSLKRECWLIKETNTEIWINAGLPYFAFQRLEGVFIEQGIVAPFSLAKCGESLAWLSKNEQGQAIIVITDGYQLRRISTHQVERRIQGYVTNGYDISKATAYSYQQEGHLFYLINFNLQNARGAAQTWCYDFNASQKLQEPCWHQRASLVQGNWNRHWGDNHCFAYGKNVIGDYQSGNLYAFDLVSPLDNGQQRRWLRSWQALPQPSDNPVSFDWLRIDMQTGINAQVGANPLCQLRWSNDDGLTWPVTRYAPVGKTGETTRRVMFRRLGSTKSHKGLNRSFELSSCDIWNCAIVGAELQ